MNREVPLSAIGAVAMDRDMSDAEWTLRIEFAAAFRIAHHLGWNADTLNHMTARVPGTETFLMNPLGLGWDEITASSLVTVGYDRTIHSHSGAHVAPAGFNFHSGILKARRDLNCVIHTHCRPGTVISALAEGLSIFDQGGCRLYDEVGYHDFEGLAREEDEVPRILRDLGPTRHTLIMRNHGLLAVGVSVADAFGWMRTLTDACALQERIMATGGTRVALPAELQARTKAQLASNGPKRPPGDISWPYWMRLAQRLDPGFAG
jgi:ribulose-5-phosphate 4-epimerase/fuculose-1-phosphate aldolase